MPKGVNVNLTPEKEQWIKDQLLSGATQLSIANTLGLSPSWIHQFAKRLSETDPDFADVLHTNTVSFEATLAKLKDKRVKLLLDLVDKVEEILPTVSTPSGIQQLSVALGILIDKSRLEEGSTTAKTEVSTDSARETVTSRIAELTKRRAAA